MFISTFVALSKPSTFTRLMGVVVSQGVNDRIDKF